MAASEDHRVRVARERRERMRARLLDAVLHLCSAEVRGALPTIDDVVRHADVARGTFYKHFNSIEQAVSELGAAMADEMTAGIARVYDVLTEPVMRTATGFQLFLLRAMLDAKWGMFIARIGLLRDQDLFTSKIRSDILLGIDAGSYNVGDVECAADLLMGAKIEAILRLNSGNVSIPYVKAMTAMVLTAFGVAGLEAMAIVDRAFDRIVAESPGRLTWWRELPGAAASVRT